MGKIRPVTRDEHRACFVLSRIAYFCVREISPHEWQICVNFALESHETRRTQRRGGVRTLSKFLWLPRGDGGGVEGFWWCLTCWTIFSSPQIPRHNRSWRCNETPSSPPPPPKKWEGGGCCKKNQRTAMEDIAIPLTYPSQPCVYFSKSTLFSSPEEPAAISLRHEPK